MAGDGRLGVDVLGPIRARDDQGRGVTPEGGLQRRLLALVVLHRGRVVSADAAIEALWPGTPPRDPTAALQNHVFRLRRGLPDDLIASEGAGYRLDPSRIDLDADRLAAAVHAEERSGAVLAALDAVLARWRGPAYPELDEVDEGRAEALRLEDLRLRALEVRAECRLAIGDTDGLVAELAALAEAAPLRERPRALLMTALARTDRNVEALRVYDDFRRLLGDELGVEPSPALAAQHAELLAGGSSAVWVPATRLPVAATSFVGRGALAMGLAASVEAHRLVSLVGPGGVGKTRLLVEVGHRLRAVRPDRPVVLCELAATDAATAVDGVATSLGVDARPGVPVAQRVAAVLGDTEIVVLLDNCEHVLEPVAALVDRLLVSCPHVTVVTTSRERLRVGGEQVCVVPVLGSDGEGSPAVQLFVERARAVVPDFEPDGDERACIAEVVRRLDGLPLAIELAAARLHTHDVGEVAAGLDHRFALLSSGYRTSSRHASLGAAVSWSFGLLDPDLQETFASLSVFGGSFTATDAAAVCGVEVASVSPALAQLTERSLVMRAPDRRYMLLETLRAFGAEQLAALGREQVVGDRHARHLVDWVERADERLLAPGPVVAEIDAAVPELRAALGWLIEHDEVELAGRLVAALLDYGMLRLRPDVLSWAERVTRADPEDRSPVASLVWVVAAYAAWMAGDVGETGVRSARALQVAERAEGDVPAEVATILGSFHLFQGHLEEAARWYRRGVELARDDRAQQVMAGSSEVLALGYAGAPLAAERAAAMLTGIGEAEVPMAAYAWYCAGEADLALGDTARARARLARALEVAERTGASFVTGIAGASKASMEARLGEPAAAAEDYRRLIVHWRRAGMWSTQWTMLRSIAALLDRLGRPHDAAVLAGAVQATASGHRIFGADEVALRELGARLRDTLGDDAYTAALAEGAALDGDAAIEHALRAL